MMLEISRRIAGIVLAVLLISTAAVGHSHVPAQPQISHESRDHTLGATPVSYWGINAYLSKRERLTTNDDLTVLTRLMQQTHADWTREELTWAVVEPQPAAFHTLYDHSLRTTAEAGLNIIGVLLTTPAWARDPACQAQAGQEYWCPPADVTMFARYAGWMTERYDGDGVDDAPGSPRIAAWEIWNEPNDPALWPELGTNSNARKQRYGEMLVAAYQAIKAADPTALVLVGGVYVFDGSCQGVCDGFNFLGGAFSLVPAASNAFDVFAIHPYMPTVAPDQPGLYADVSLEGRLYATQRWLTQPPANRPDAPIWITEMGWCTAPGSDACPAVGEDEQANYLVRSMVLAQQIGIQHTSWLQLEDAFNDMSHPWSGTAMLRDLHNGTYPTKPAYLAYSAMVRRLHAAQPTGIGPLHTHVYQSGTPLAGGVYDYRYVDGPTTIDVLWQSGRNQTVQFPVITGKQVKVMFRNGGEAPLTPRNGVVSVSVGETPIYVVQSEPSRLLADADPLVLLAEPGTSALTTTLHLSNLGDGALAWTATTDQSWLTIDQTAGSTPASISISINLAGKAIGTYNGNIVFSTSVGTTLTVPVQVRVVSTLYRSYTPLIQR